MPHEELNLAFSVSAPTRPPRGQEQHGVEDLFMSPEEFRKHIAANDFIEYEEVYTDRFYGTLKSQVDNQLAEGQNVVFDVDVHGGMRLKECFGSHALSLFIQPPSIDVLRQRLEGRGTDSPEVIQQRLDRAEYELSFAPYFDHIVINDDLDAAKADAYKAIQEFLS
jgi:guanylate kinase